MAKISINLKAGKVEKAKEAIIVGIDLGTTNSLVAYMKNGAPLSIKDEAGSSSLMPSIVHFASEDNGVLVGEEAKERLILEPERTIYSVKRLMGKSYKDLSQLKDYLGYRVIDEDEERLVKIQVGEKFFTPIQLSAEILKALRDRIEKSLDVIVSKAVITVPAYFNDAQRQATRDAGKLAGLDVLRIVNEPTAASLAYGIGMDKDATQKIAVYDLGGGTFDVSILSIEAGIFEVLSTNGNTFLGGDDFDRAILDYWLMDQAADSLSKSDMQALRLTAEEAKKTLSNGDKFESEVAGISCHITREKFINLIEPLVTETLGCCQKALADAGLNKEDIEQVVMVGGSTKVPYVKSAVSGFFGKQVNDHLNPDEVVALGAAVQADVLAGNQKDILLLDITPLSLGIETVGGLMDVIIPRNSKVPHRAARQYTTSVDGQKNLKVAVFQGERDLVEHNRKLGEFVLRNIPPMAAGFPKIEVAFIINADGIMTVRAKELRSNVEQAIELRSQYGLSEEEMAKMLLDSIKNASSDMEMRSLLEARNEGNNLVQASKKFLEQNDAILTEEEKTETVRLSGLLKVSIDGTDKDLINQAIANLNDYTTPLAHRAMDHTIQEAMKGKGI